MGALKNSPGGCRCCVTCGTVSLPSTLFFNIAGIGPISLGGPGGTSGVWSSSTGAIHAPGTEIDVALTCTTLPYIEMFVQFGLFLTPNMLGQCFNLILSARWAGCAGACVPGFKGTLGSSFGATLGPSQVNVTGVLSSFTWSPFVSSWTFGTSWDVIPNYGTVLAGGTCGGATAPLALVPPISGAATLTH